MHLCLEEDAQRSRCGAAGFDEAGCLVKIDVESCREFGGDVFGVTAAAQLDESPADQLREHTGALPTGPDCRGRRHDNPIFDWAGEVSIR